MFLFLVNLKYVYTSLIIFFLNFFKTEVANNFQQKSEKQKFS